MEEKNRGKTACNLRWIMKVRRVICSAGPTSQLTYISQFMATPTWEAYPSLGSPATFMLWRPLRRIMHSSYFWLQARPRQKGIGSVPSAINTACSARINEFPTGAKPFGIAKYIPANAKAVSTISTVLFMGESSEVQISSRAKYMPWRVFVRLRPVDNFRIGSSHEGRG